MSERVVVQSASKGRLVVENYDTAWQKMHEKEISNLPAFVPHPRFFKWSDSYKSRTSLRRVEDKSYLKSSNVKAFLDAIAEAEGGEYDFMYGAVKGQKGNKYRMMDYSTHPGAGVHGGTPAGRYQIIKDTWERIGKILGLSDFSPDTQDLMAIEILRASGIVKLVVAGDIDKALPAASVQWSTLPQGPNKPGKYEDRGQIAMKYDKFIALYESKGGRKN